ncbi:transcriptional regulator, TetR family [Psychrobacillus sp. OK028]|uniref:TetR/AcrR family transcriptional regulator n=1 Tax=Psychrobacillus sp. OK028 TaxID=1884359 RepID=UPI00088E9F6D|nr:TetR/AcrR family transcriptional regulator [Psychrobacillus sp. OK028]SDO17020.1 transcriptional regulator, TetR family [Psychrobacillus sp. OK028]
MDRRQEIVDAATKSFSLFGYKATTMEQIAKIANVGKGTIYTFFDNKEVLFQEIVLRIIAEMKQEATKVIKEEATFQENAYAALMKMLEFRETHELFSKIIAEEQELKTPQVKQMKAQIEQAIVSFIKQKIDKYINAGEVRQVNSELVAYLLLKGYLAFVNDWNLTHEKSLTEQEIADFFQGTIFKSLII